MSEPAPGDDQSTHKVCLYVFGSSTVPGSFLPLSSNCGG